MMNQPRTDTGRRRVFPTLLAIAFGLLGTAAGAAEVYTWTDENGVLHYSDTPRADGEMDTLDVEEIYRPGSTDAYSAPAVPAEPTAAAGTEATSDAPTEAPRSAAQQRREQIASDRAERLEQQQETERLCQRHRQRLEQMEPARRVFYTNEQGEEVRMDDDQRIGLIEESRAFLAANCEG